MTGKAVDITIAAVVIALIVVIAYAFFASGSSRLVGEGVYESTEYTGGGWGTADKTIVHWRDGQTTILRRSVPIRMITGRYYKIYVTRYTNQFTEVVEENGP